VNVPALKLAHLDAMIARGRFVPLRKRPDTRPTSTRNLINKCELCGRLFRYSWLANYPPERCKPCRGADVASLTIATLAERIAKALPSLGVEWFNARAVAAASGVSTDSVHYHMRPWVARGQYQTRFRCNRTGRQWRLKS
jgi:hypothetical protein